MMTGALKCVLFWTGCSPQAFLKGFDLSRDLKNTREGGMRIWAEGMANNCH